MANKRSGDRSTTQSVSQSQPDLFTHVPFRKILLLQSTYELSKTRLKGLASPLFRGFEFTHCYLEDYVLPGDQFELMFDRDSQRLDVGAALNGLDNAIGQSNCELLLVHYSGASPYGWYAEVLRERMPALLSRHRTLLIAVEARRGHHPWTIPDIEHWDLGITHWNLPDRRMFVALFCRFILYPPSSSMGSGN